MNISPRHCHLASLALIGLAALQSPQVQAQTQPASSAPSASSAPIDRSIGSADKWELTISPYAYHWSHSPEHRSVYLIGVERHLPDNWLWGAGFFSNSFGQPSAYAYYGYRWDNLFDQPSLYAKLTVGLMYGYVGQYKNKVPLNFGGFSPLVIPALGYRITKQDSVQIAPLGKAALLFTYNRSF
ncbi:hypothetical protein [Variovorax sp. PAMC26660]|jgi:hypothetical protein|uniref:hypothetical protein n=1 Tax=Variovorax sp. PAMC26660 TaxID=2762322 RepID=UPI0021C37EA4|nr:hypothetical protein [Variovorax sp. PAMC26660]